MKSVLEKYRKLLVDKIGRCVQGIRKSGAGRSKTLLTRAGQYLRRIDMMRLEKYKILLAGGGILLSIVMVSLVANYSNLKQNIGGDKPELGMISESGITGDSQTKKDKQMQDRAERDSKIEEDNQKEQSDENEITETLDKVDKNTYKEDKNNDGKEDSVERKGGSTYALKNNSNNSVKNQEQKETKPAQTKGATNNSTSKITADSYTVKSGDTLFLISQRANVSMDHLMRLNNLHSDMIYENQVLKVRGSTNNSSYQVVSRGGNRRSEDDLYWLSRVIHSEAQGESYTGKVAVGNVIVNRVNSELFPDTIKGVVFDKQDGHTQFSPVLDGSIYNTPDTESVRAAEEVLDGVRPVGNALYFLNPRKSTNFWIVGNRRYMTTIGLHDFYY